MVNNFLHLFSGWDGLTVLMVSLVVFIGLCVGSFSTRYMKGDAQYRPFFIRLTLLVLSTSVLVSVDNLIIFFLSWCLSNALLVRLMIHQSNWKAARASGILAAKNYLIGSLCIGSAFIVFYSATGAISINAIAHENAKSMPMLIALVLILMGAMIQSAIWPFHRWLISSLNSPTPVSAIMHAGLVNGGGFLLVRFAPLYLQHGLLLNIIFLMGLSSSFLGTLWKLMRSDVKRMLACSTMGQMGFMLTQCGLGLFPAAVAHLLWHGMFKAYLFLSSGSAAQEKRFDLDYPPKLAIFFSSLFCGLTGSLGFGYITGKSWLAGDTTLVLMVITFISASQFALPILRFKTYQRLPLALLSTAIIGLCYGVSVQMIAWIMGPMGLMQAQKINALHIIGIVFLVMSWLCILFFRNQSQKIDFPSWMLRGYVAALNGSQPQANTVTAHRNQYTYG